MTTLMELPREILIIVIKQLDTKSVYNLYKTCRALKDVILMEGVIKVCNLSISALATSKSLNLDMIKEISGHLTVLSMYGVADLKKHLLLPALSRMKRLETLDVSYTEIDAVHMVDLYRKCPTIKNVIINIPETLSLNNKTLQECQEVYKNFNTVHFIVKMRLTVLTLDLFRKSSFDTLKFTVCDADGLRDTCLFMLYQNEPFLFKHLCVFLVNYGYFYPILILPPDELESLEYIVIRYNGGYSIYTTPTFINFFAENFQITSFFSLSESHRAMDGTFAIFIWHKKTTVFDELFFFNLKKRIKEIIVCTFEAASGQSMPSGIDTHCYDWFHIHPKIHNSDNRTERENFEPDLKKRRIVQNDQILDYDKIFKQHKNIKLTVSISQSVNVTLSPNSEYLSNLTYLNLGGALVRYSNEFFNILFRCCTNLTTLNVESSSVCRCCSFIMRSIPLSQSLKHLRLVDKRIDLKTLFSSFTQCKSLETICVIDNLSELHELSDLLILSQCVNLYSVYIVAQMKKATMKKALYKEISNHFVNFSLKYPKPNCSIKVDPYLHIFNLEPIKAV